MIICELAKARDYYKNLVAQKSTREEKLKLIEEDTKYDKLAISWAFGGKCSNKNCNCNDRKDYRLK